MGRRSRMVAAMVLAACATASAGAGVADAAFVTKDLRVTTSDGVSLLAKVGGEGSLTPRPTIVEFGPYGQSCCTQYAGPDYNYLHVHIRGTGGSDGRFNALGAQGQRDVVEVLRWACAQPWSAGRLGLYGFSASAIAIYNTLDRTLPCVRTAVLMAGTDDLYRDLMYPGGIPNLVPAVGVFAGISAPILPTIPERLARNPLSLLDAERGMQDTGLAWLQRPTEDAWWRERSIKGDVNRLPLLLVTSFYDVEARGPFETFRRLGRRNWHLLAIGAHDGTPAGLQGVRDAAQKDWYDRYLRDVDNHVERQPRVQLWLSDGDREKWTAGRFVKVDGSRWPLRGTRWQALALDAARSGSARSVNDGSLTVGASPVPTRQSYPTVPSLPTATDQHTTALLSASAGMNGYADAFPAFTDMTLAEPLGLSYTTRPLAADVAVAGPASLELRLASTAPETDIYAIVSDVAPDGSANPIATGRLRTSYPFVDRERSLRDKAGRIVQPYGRFDAKTLTPPGQERLYRVEFWPIGNRFRRGHRLRLHLLGVSAFHVPAGVALDTVTVGGAHPSRLLVPVLPGSDLVAALR